MARTVSELLEALADAARAGARAEFDVLERELLSHFDGRFESMPPDVHERYLDVDRHWPIVTPHGQSGAPRRTTLRLSLPVDLDAWLRELGAELDRSPSAIVAACLDRIRGDDDLRREVIARLNEPGDA